MVKRRGTVAVPGIDVGTVLDQVLDGREVPVAAAKVKNGLILGKNLPDISFGSSVDQMSNDLLVFLPAGNLDQGVRVEDASFPVDVEP